MNTTKNLALRKPLLISAWLLAMQGATYAQNPIVQTQLTTDPAPLVVGDRLYVYTGHDEDKADFFWMNEWRVFHQGYGELDRPWFSARPQFFSWADDRAWAAQTIERNGKYYWYICAHSKLTGGMAIGVAVLILLPVRSRMRWENRFSIMEVGTISTQRFGWTRMVRLISIGVIHIFTMPN